MQLVQAAALSKYTCTGSAIGG